VLGVELAVEADRGVDPLHHRGRAAREAAAPQPVGGAGGGGVGVARRAHEGKVSVVSAKRRISGRTAAVALGVFGAVIVIMWGVYARFGADAADRPPRRGAMQQFALQDTPAPLPAISFVDRDQKERSLADFQGRVVLLNLWATWCAPCIKEMPSLERLQAQLAGSDFTVLALSVDRGGLPLVEKFYGEHGLKLDMFI